MSLKYQDDSSTVRSAASGDSEHKKKKKKTAHFKKRGHPAFKVLFLVCALLTFLSIIMACVSTVMLIIS